jgi:hypothetical protein
MNEREQEIYNQIQQMNQDTINNLTNVNQTINEIMRRSNDLRRSINSQSSLLFFLEDFNARYRSLIFSKKCFLISIFVFIGLSGGLYFSARNIDFSDMHTLEKDEMILTYFCLFSIFYLIMWNFYLFVTLILLKIEDKKNKSVAIMMAEKLFFNPLVFLCILYIFNRSHFSTSFDIFGWSLLNTHYFHTHFFTLKLHKFTAFKLSSITNISLDENRYMMNRARIGFLFLITNTFLTIYLSDIVISEAEFWIKYLSFFKGLYLFLKQIELWIIDELHYSSILSEINIQEKNLARDLSYRSKTEIFNLIIILHLIIIVTFHFLRTHHFIYFSLFLATVTIQLLYAIYTKYTTYKRMLNFYVKLDSLY